MIGRKPTYEELEQRIRELEIGSDKRKQAFAEKNTLLDNILTNAQDVAIATTDLDFRINFYNPMAEKIYGYTAEEVFGKTVQEIHTKENVEPERFERAIGIVRRNGKYCYCVTKETGDGLSYFNSQVASIFDPDGKVIGFSLFGRDVTEAKNTEKALRERERYLTGLNDAAQILLASADTVLFQEFIDKIGPALDTSRAYIFMNHHDPDGRLLTSQKAEWCAEGISPEIKNQLLQDLPYNKLIPRCKEILSRGEIINGAVADFPDNEREILEPQGILALLLIPIMVDGKFAGFIGFDNCVSERKWSAIEQTFLSAASKDLAQTIKRTRSEKQILASLKEKEVLLREIHHRVKNNMQVIVSLLRMHSMRTNDTCLGHVFDDCRDRINAMSLIHEALYQSENLARIDFKIYLNNLCKNLIQAYGASGKGIAVTVDQCNVDLDMDQGIAVGMVVCELVSNAFKHAFPQGKGGEILISLSSLEGEMIKLIVQDNGKCLPLEIDIFNPPSLGLQLATSTVTQGLDGSITVERNGGTRFIIRFKCRKKL